jgi:pyruvate dehydrogenase E1 component
MFGFQRVWDFIWAACDMRTRGFLLGGTAGRTTLNGEGLQHQDGHSHLAAAATPNIKAYDLAYAYEIATVVHCGMKEMCQDDKDVIYYLTVENENYAHPPMPRGIENDIIKGLYRFKSTENPVVALLGSGPLMGEVIAAAKLLEKDWGFLSNIWNVTSFSELRKEAEEVDRWNSLNLEKKQKEAHLVKVFRDQNIPIVAVSDYIKMVPQQIGPYIKDAYYVLGTDGFGRSDTRENLRRFFEVDRFYVVLTALRALVNEGNVEKEIISKAMKKYKIDSDKPSPITA